MLDLIAGPFDVHYLDDPIKLLGGYAWDDRFGLMSFSIIDNLVFYGVAQIDGSFFPKHVNSGTYANPLSLDLVRDSLIYNRNDASRFSFDRATGTIGDLFFFGGSPAKPVKVLDRYLNFGAASVTATPLTGPFDGTATVAEANISDPLLGAPVSQSTGGDGAIVVGCSNGSIYSYSPGKKQRIGPIKKIGQACDQLFYSQKLGAFVSVHQLIDRSQIRVWCSETPPATVTNPLADGSFETGKSTKVTVTVKGSAGEPVSNHAVSWSANVSGTFSSQTTLTDDAGVAETYFVPSALGSVTITAEALP